MFKLTFKARIFDIYTFVVEQVIESLCSNCVVLPQETSLEPFFIELKMWNEKLRKSNLPPEPGS